MRCASLCNGQGKVRLPEGERTNERKRERKKKKVSPRRALLPHAHTCMYIQARAGLSLSSKINDDEEEYAAAAAAVGGAGEEEPAAATAAAAAARQ